MGMLMKHSKYITVLAVLFCACQNTTDKWTSTKPVFNEISSPCKEGGEANLFVSETGDVYLSWVEFLNDTTDALMFSKMENGQWGKATEIARGTDWFVNWADFPSLSADGNWLAAHWLQKSTGETYDYDIRISQSTDGGQNWQASFIPHPDGIAAEHGFATMFPISKERTFAVWLDGGNTKGSPQQGHGHSHGGAMALRTAEFDPAGKLYAEVELDNRICDCCQTDAVLTAQGPVVVYRDRSEHEIRDISIVRKVEGKWTKPHLIHADNWETTACPVNGPAIAAEGDLLVVAWFSAADGKASVKVAFSSDAGASFSPPVQVDEGKPLGRVDVEILDTGHCLVTWLENTDPTAEIRAAITSKNGKKGESMLLATTSPERSSGFPVLAKNKDHFLLAWTAVDSISTTVKTASWYLR